MLSNKSFTLHNALGLIAVIIVNGLANALPINSLNTGELSAMYPNLFVPAGFTFGIWGVIYLLTIGWVSLFLFKKEGTNVYGKLNLGPWFLISCLANISWILLWHYRFVGGSVVMMLLLLYSLTRLYIQAKPSELAWVKVPISVYLSWICVATIANVTTLFIDLGVTGGDAAPIISTIMIGVATILAGIFIYRMNDLIFPLVTIWALYGINVKHAFTAIDIVTWAGITFLILSVGYAFINRRQVI